MSADSDPIVIGRFGRTYGIKGWVRIISATDPIENILDYFPWRVKRAGDWQTLDILDTRLHGNGIIALVKGYSTPEAAQTLTNLDICAAHSQLPTLPDDEYYWRDLVGLTVINQQGETLGTVTKLLETGSNDVLVVTPPETAPTDNGAPSSQEETLIPFLIDQFVMKVDLKKQQLLVDWEQDF